jgi:AraC-like DNA-binding protein
MAAIGPSARPDRMVAVCARRLLDDPEQRVSVSALARSMNIHPVHLAREFRRTFGMSLREYRTTQLVKRAAALVVGTKPRCRKSPTSAGSPITVTCAAHSAVSRAGIPRDSECPELLERYCGLIADSGCIAEGQEFLLLLCSRPNFVKQEDRPSQIR